MNGPPVDGIDPSRSAFEADRHEYDADWEGGQYPDDQTENAGRVAIPTREVRQAIAAVNGPGSKQLGAIEVGRRLGIFTRKELDQLNDRVCRNTSKPRLGGDR